jgi:hypothetical protein
MQATGDDTASYTIIGVFALVNDRLKLIYAHRFVGLGSNDPDYVMERIQWVMNTFGVKRLGVDYGVGYKEDLRLIAKYGLERIACFQYKSSVGKAMSTQNPGEARAPIAHVFIWRKEQSPLEKRRKRRRIVAIRGYGDSEVTP